MLGHGRVETTSLGDYQLLTLLGAGGMGEVWAAHQQTLGRRVALKLLPEEVTRDPSRISRFEQEARAASALNHPNVAHIYALGQTVDGRRYIAMELVEGETLRARLRSGHLPLPEAIRFAVQVAAALAAAHAVGVIHRDIKPENVMIRPDGFIKVLDFGLAKLVASSPSDVAAATRTMVHTDAGAVLGTAAYMSPEQVRGREVDQRTDIWSLGAMLYEMVAGRCPFAGESRSDVLAAILDREPAPLARFDPDVPSELQRIVGKALRKDRNERYQDMKDQLLDLQALRDDLAKQAWRGHEETSLPGPTDATSVAPPSDVHIVADLLTRHRTTVFAIVAASLIAVISIGYLAQRRRPTTTSSLSLDHVRITQLTTSGNADEPAISADGRHVAYIQQNAGNTSVWVRQVAATGSVQIVSPSEDVRVASPNISPDGTFVDFIRIPKSFGTTPSLWRVPFLGGQPRKLIENVWGSAGWSPDGARMAYVRVSDRTMETALIVADPAGDHEQVIAIRRSPRDFVSLRYGGGGANMRPAWSPDGKRIAVLGFETAHDDTQVQIVIVNALTGSEHTFPIGHLGVNCVGWLDGESLLVAADQFGNPTQLWRFTTSTGQLTRFTNDFSTFEGISLTADRDSFVAARREFRTSIWVGDETGRKGAEIVPPAIDRSVGGLAWLKDQLLFVNGAQSPPSIMSKVPGAGDPAPLIARGAFPAATSDGKTIVYVPDPFEGLWKADADGQHSTQLAKEMAVDPVITPNDKYVIFRTAGSGHNVRSVPLNGGAATPLPVSARRVDISPDGKSLVLVTRTDQGQFGLATCELPECSALHSFPIAATLAKWRSGGREIAFVPLDRPHNLWLEAREGGPPRQVTEFDDTREIVDFAWSRYDGRLAIARSTRTSDIVIFKGLLGTKVADLPSGKRLARRSGVVGEYNPSLIPRSAVRKAAEH